jgi:hypothetical protein
MRYNITIDGNGELADGIKAGQGLVSSITSAGGNVHAATLTEFDSGTVHGLNPPSPLPATESTTQTAKPLTKRELKEEHTAAELREIATEEGIEIGSHATKEEIAAAIVAARKSEAATA